MSQLGRNMKDAVIIDNSPTSYMLQPECGIPIVSWYDDMSDRALYDYIPFLIELSKVNDMREAVTSAVHNNALEVNYAINVCLGIQENEKIAKRQKEIEIARVRKAQ
jgi:TFIIF-interacting CTD phosphatase-like protein